jgi:hypothetical protein
LSIGFFHRLSSAGRNSAGILISGRRKKNFLGRRVWPDIGAVAGVPTLHSVG